MKMGFPLGPRLLKRFETENGMTDSPTHWAEPVEMLAHMKTKFIHV